MGEPGSSLGKKSKMVHLWHQPARLAVIADTKPKAEKKFTALVHRTWKDKTGAAVVQTGQVKSSGMFPAEKAQAQKKPKSKR